MVIDKDGKKYIVKEYKNKWTVSKNSGKLLFTYDIEKEICCSFEELKRYVLKNDIF